MVDDIKRALPCGVYSAGALYRARILIAGKLTTLVTFKTQIEKSNVCANEKKLKALKKEVKKLKALESKSKKRKLIKKSKEVK